MTEHKISHSAERGLKRREGWIRPVQEFSPTDKQEEERWLKQPWTLRRKVSRRQRTHIHTLLRKQLIKHIATKDLLDILQAQRRAPNNHYTTSRGPRPSRPFRPYTFSKQMTNSEHCSEVMSTNTNVSVCWKEISYVTKDRLQSKHFWNLTSKRTGQPQFTETHLRIWYPLNVTYTVKNLQISHDPPCDTELYGLYRVYIN